MLQYLCSVYNKRLCPLQSPPVRRRSDITPPNIVSHVKPRLSDTAEEVRNLVLIQCIYQTICLAMSHPTSHTVQHALLTAVLFMQCLKRSYNNKHYVPPLLLLLLLNFITDSLLHTCAGKYVSCPNYKHYNKDTTLQTTDIVISYSELHAMNIKQPPPVGTYS